MGVTRNLWGNFPKTPEGTLPRNILNKQRDYLDEAMEGELISEINHYKEKGKVKFCLSVYPFESDELQTDIVSVTHSINIYPASLKNGVTGEDPWHAEDEGAFIKHLERILSSPDVMNTINRFRLIAAAHKNSNT